MATGPKHPEGWTSNGLPSGFMRRKPHPNDLVIKRQAAEIDRLRRRLERLETAIWNVPSPEESCHG